MGTLRNYSSRLFFIVIFLILPGTALAQILPPISVSSLAPLKPVSQTEAELRGLGCQELTPSGLPFFKTISIPLGLDQQPVSPSDYSSWTNYWFCPASALPKLGAPIREPGWLDRLIYQILQYLLVGFAGLGLWLMGFVTQLMAIALGLSGYFNNSVVRTTWPFLLGIMNFGYILILLFIALASALQLSSYSWQKILPRLLISALLINFSLLIGVIMTDASRVLMAIELSVSGTSNIYTVGEELLKKSGIANAVIQGVAAPSDFSLQATVDVAVRTIFIWFFTLGLLFFSILLLVRHAMLILLLAVSPVAFFAFILPNTSNIAKRWWTEFIKWTLFGPIALFIIIVLSVAGSGVSVNGGSPFFDGAVSLLVMTILLVGATRLGLSLGGTGATEAINRTKQLGGIIRRNPGTALGLAAGMATGGASYLATGAAVGGLGGALAGNKVKKNVSAFMKERAKFMTAREEDQSKSSLGNALGKQYYPQSLATKKGRDGYKDAQEAEKSLSKTPDFQTNSKFSAQNLANPHFTTNFSPNTAVDLYVNGSASQRLSMTSALSTAKQGIDKDVANNLTNELLLNLRPEDTPNLKRLLQNQEFVEQLSPDRISSILERAVATADTDMQD